MRRVKSKKAIGGGGERDNVVAKSGATQLCKLVLMVEQTGRNATHRSKVETFLGASVENLNLYRISKDKVLKKTFLVSIKFKYMKSVNKNRLFKSQLCEVTEYE